MDCFVASAFARRRASADTPRNDVVRASVRFKHPHVRSRNSTISRRVSPELCQRISLPSTQRALGGRAPDAPDSRVCNGVVVEGTRVSQVTPESPGTPRAMVYGLYLLSSVSPALLPPSLARLDANLTPALGVSGPHDFAVRFRHPGQGAPSASTASPSRTDDLGQCPSEWDGMAIDIVRFSLLENRNIFPRGA